MNNRLNISLLPETGGVLCAVSGGRDSIYLLHSLIRFAGDEKKLSVCCGHFNHRLRGAESDRDEKFVEDFCRENGVPFLCGSGDVAAYAAENRLGTEEAARILRYGFLNEAAQKLGCSVIATAHNADDNAETMLLNLARGAGLRGLCGIPPVRDNIIRPILGVTRREIDEYLEKNGVGFVEDSTNAENDYSRNRIRHMVSPVLRGINPKFAENAFKASELMRADEEFITSLAERFLLENRDGNAIAAIPASELPGPVLSRVIRIMSGAELSLTHVKAVMALCGGHCGGRAFADLPGMRVARERDRLVFGVKTQACPGIAERELVIPGETPVPEAGIVLKSHIEGQEAGNINKSFNILRFNYKKICGKITLKSRHGGESIRLCGRKCTKTVKKLFSEAGIPAGERDKMLLFSDTEGLIALQGFGVSERCAAAESEPVLVVEIVEEKERSEETSG